MTASQSACKHDLSERSTLTLTIPLGHWPSRQSFTDCWACGCRLADGALSVLRSHVAWREDESRNVSLLLREGAPLSSSPTDSSSSSPAPTPAASDTCGTEACPTTSPSWAPMSSHERSTLFQNALEHPELFEIDNTSLTLFVTLEDALKWQASQGRRIVRLTRLSDGLSVAAGREELAAMVKLSSTAPGR